MEKAWFKLRQTDYPPQKSEAMGTEKETAPLCLGHFVQDLNRLDFPINRDDIEPFPPSMPIYYTNSLNFSWKEDRAVAYGVELGGSASVLATTGVPITAKADVETIFRDSVSNYEQYKRLDTYIIQVTTAYIEKCLKRATITKYVEDNSPFGRWSVYVITGLKIARAGSTSASSSHETKDLPLIASVQAEPNVTRSKDTTMAAEKQSDFIWAIRIAKVHKGMLVKDWSVETYTKKATLGIHKDVRMKYYSVGPTSPKATSIGPFTNEAMLIRPSTNLVRFIGRKSEMHVEHVVSAEGVTPTRVLEDDLHDETFVILPEQGQL
ncbi:hypothetical protein CPAR01_01152 [Colletotrichum paranaense]|uniref:Uncharacterized protein n=1 Tax=Colletotrichum paranaense TaxID=1914294 RepID=A0ABQ9T5Y4_9PEZI|nr:uncharacterized protein CPAR01_01152 [Colletotrichum paranaense]KAK1547185.1 hypothetical protein CPAR01_01152 [Colletotrichum paranaense]